MLVINTAKEYKDFGKKIPADKIFETCKSTIDVANTIDELIDDINNNDTKVEITTLSRFVLSRISMLINKRYIKYKNVSVKLYQGNSKQGIQEFSCNRNGMIEGLDLTIYSPSMKPINVNK